MNRFLSLLFFLVIPLSVIAEGESGTAAEARAMLERAVNALQTDETKALAAFNSGSKEYMDRDLYVFCAGPDGILTAHPTMKGENLKDIKDENGKALGEEMMAKAQEGKIATVKYMWPRPGTDKPVPKETFVTKVADQLCGVGYYKKS